MRRLLLIAALAVSSLPVARAADIVDTAIGAGQFTTLVKAVQVAGLVETLKSPGPFTVFAPTDAAFAKLPAGTLQALLNDPEKLKAILLYHVVSGKVMAADVKTGPVKTVQGSSAKLKVSDGKVMIDNATVITADVMADNGVIHVIDAVIVPKM